MFKDQVYTAMVVKSLPNGRRMAYTLVVVIWVSLFLPQELGFEEVQSVLLLDRFSTVQGVLAYYSEAAKGKAKKWPTVFLLDQISLKQKSYNWFSDVFSCWCFFFPQQQLGAQIHLLCNQGRWL